MFARKKETSDNKTTKQTFAKHSNSEKNDKKKTYATLTPTPIKTQKQIKIHKHKHKRQHRNVIPTVNCEIYEMCQHVMQVVVK